MANGTLQLDDLLRVLLAEYDAAHTQNTKYFASLHIAANVAGDGQVSFEEFLAVLRFLDPGRMSWASPLGTSHRKVTRVSLTKLIPAS